MSTTSDAVPVVENHGNTAADAIVVENVAGVEVDPQVTTSDGTGNIKNSSNKRRKLSSVMHTGDNGAKATLHLQTSTAEALTNLMGTVRMFNADKGWGFIDGDTVGSDIFLHAKHILGDVPTFWIGHQANTKDREKAARAPQEQVRVTFDLTKSSNGKPQAVNVRLLFPLEGKGPTNTDSKGNGQAPDNLHELDRTCSSPTCANCGSTVAARLGIMMCPICRHPLPPDLLSM